MATSATPIRVSLHLDQIPHFKRQASIFCSALERSANIKIKKSNHLNLFSKMCGYSSFATLLKQAQRNTTNEPLMLTGDPAIIQAMKNNLSQLNIFPPDTSEARSNAVIDAALESLPKGYEFDLVPGTPRHFGFGYIDAYMVFGEEQECVIDGFRDIKVKYSHLDRELAPQDIRISDIAKPIGESLRDAAGICSAVLLYDASLSDDVEPSPLPTHYQFSLSEKLHQLKSGDLLCATREVTKLYVGDAPPTTSEYTDLMYHRYRIFMLFESDRPVEIKDAFLAASATSMLGDWINGKSTSDYYQYPIFSKVHTYPLVDVTSPEELDDEYEDDPDYYDSYAERASEALQYELMAIKDDDYDTLKENLREYLDLHPDSYVGIPIGEGEFRLGVFLANKKQSSMYLREFSQCGPGGGELNTFIFRNNHNLFSNTKFYFKNPRYCDDSLTEEMLGIGNKSWYTAFKRESKTSYVKAIKNEYSSKPIIGLPMITSSLPWTGVEDDLKSRGATHVVVDVMCESYGDRECFFIVSFCNSTKLIAQSTHSIVVPQKQDRYKKLSIYKDLDALKARFIVNTVFHEAIHPKFYTGQNTPLLYSNPAKAELEGCLVLSFVFRFAWPLSIQDQSEIDVSALFKKILDRTGTPCVNATIIYPTLIPVVGSFNATELANRLAADISSQSGDIEKMRPMKEIRPAAADMFCGYLAVRMDDTSSVDTMMIASNMASAFTNTDNLRRWRSANLPELEMHGLYAIEFNPIIATRLLEL